MNTKQKLMITAAAALGVSMTGCGGSQAPAERGTATSQGGASTSSEPTSSGEMSCSSTSTGEMSCGAGSCTGHADSDAGTP